MRSKLKSIEQSIKYLKSVVGKDPSLTVGYHMVTGLVLLVQQTLAESTIYNIVSEKTLI
jgi:hypothetical protein